MAKKKKLDWDVDPRQETWPLDWGHTAKTPYAKSTMAAVLQLPLSEAQSDELIDIRCRNPRRRVFGKAVFDQLSPELQKRLRELAAKGVGRITRGRDAKGVPRLRTKKS